MKTAFLTFSGNSLFGWHPGNLNSPLQKKSLGVKPVSWIKDETKETYIFIYNRIGKKSNFITCSNLKCNKTCQWCNEED
jgi:hypothetical protein